MLADDLFQLVRSDHSARFRPVRVLQSRIHLPVLGNEPREVRLVQHRRTFKEIQKFPDIARIVILAKCINLLL